ncbi:MAG: hypothetical protein HYX21_01215 [Candidatus Yanofskybacteria bacterium]|nr:hypothetical protein [Candidatus Yanofskybacteria bacterium]
MLVSIANKIKVIPGYLYRNYVAPKIYSILDRKILLKNLELKNKYVGQRCFIIGAGPSIADTDLSRLNREYTFVVNEFEKNKQYNSLTPTFHIISESNYFTESGPEYWRNRFKEKSRDVSVSTTMIFNLAAIPFIEKHSLFKQHKIYYAGTQGIFSDNLPFNINLDHYVPNPKNSILMCLIAAVWMGFSEIYLLGCEHSFLAQPLGPNKSLSFGHSYGHEISESDNVSIEVLKKYITPREMGFNYEMNMASVLQLFKNYRLFYAKARKAHSDLQIFNATPNSFLDIFPMINFEDIKLATSG